MKKVLVIMFLFIIKCSLLHAQTYDSALAKKLNADDYGMKKYILVLLKTGTADASDPQKVDSIFSGHMKNIQSLASQNKLILAGPLGENENKYEGIFVLNTDSIDEAKKMLETDPAVHEHFLSPELFVWYGSAAVQEIPAIHLKIQKKHF